MIFELSRTDRFYDVSQVAPLLTTSGRTLIAPDKVHVVAYHDKSSDSEKVTVYVRGPIVRRDQTLSTRRELSLWGRFGCPLAEAPPWIRQLALNG